MPVELTHIDLIRVGDTVLIDGLAKTVCQHNLKRGGFCGTTLWGDSYRSGTVPVQKVVFQVESSSDHSKLLQPAVDSLIQSP